MIHFDVPDLTFVGIIGLANRTPRPGVDWALNALKRDRKTSRISRAYISKIGLACRQSTEMR
jgi:hypothetical protein